jgi:hypothetical protein
MSCCVVLSSTELPEQPLNDDSTGELFLLNISRPLNDCNRLFDKCLCSFNEHTNRNFLYCNDATLKAMPNFASIYGTFDTHIKPNYPNLNLIFATVDLKGSSIGRIGHSDLDHLRIDLLPNNLRSASRHVSKMPASFATVTLVPNGGESTNSVESLLDKLKHSFTPIYHLDLDNIVDIEDGAFTAFVANSVNLTYQLAEENGVKGESRLALTKNENLLKVRFSDSRLDFASNRRPFQGLKALELHLTNLTNEYLANSIFDESSISEIFVDSSPNFVGFVDASSTLPNGKLLHRFVVIKSYKIGNFF